MIRITCAIALLLAASVAGAKTDIDKVNGSIHAEAGKEYGELETVNGSIRIEANAIVDEASTVNGGIKIEAGARVGEVETVNGGIAIGKNVAVQHDVGTVNGGIKTGQGTRIGGRLFTVNGRLTLDATEVGGAIETTSGDIEIGANSVVHGGILMEKPGRSWFGRGTVRTPRVVIGPNATVEGDLVFKREVELFVHDSAKVGKIVGAEAKRFSGDVP